MSIEFVFEDDELEQELLLESGVQPFAWDKQTTQLLVERYTHLKDAFRDSKVKKKLWAQIKNVFIAKGYNVTEEILDRKWRNLKKTYTGIKDNIRNTGRGRIHWEYYHQFDDIYRDDKTINQPQTVSASSASVSVIQKRPINVEPLKEKEVTSSTPSSEKMNSKSGMFYLRQKLADIEEARVEEIRLLRNALERNNEIQEERNKILRELCEGQRTINELL